jgi:ATP-binding cassette subfamily B (MDR/TAP) protein 8
MYGALPPGAWWEVANGAEPVFEQYADKAGDAAVVAARSGDLELVNVSFSYPVRKEMAGALGQAGHWTPALIYS